MSKYYQVTMVCKVTKLVTCEGCTREEAEERPFDFATDEMETDQHDWDVVRVEEVVV